MKIEYINEFMTLLEIGSFTQAASRLFMTQPALSKHISCLEEELGGQLLIRSTHGFELTPLGMYARDIFDDMLKLYAKLQIKVSEYAIDHDGFLRLGLVHQALDPYMKQIILRFRADYPSVHFSLFPGSQSQVIHDLLDGNTDIGFVYHGDFRNSNRLVFHDLAEESIRVALSDSSPLLAKSTVSIHDLSRLTLVTLSNDDEISHHLSSLLSKLGCRPSNYVSANSLSALSYVLPECHGFFLVPNYAVYDLPSNLAVVDLDTELSMTVALAHRKDNENNSLPLFYDSLARARS